VREIKILSESQMLENDIACPPATFSDSSTEELHRARGAVANPGLIFDLRNNSGGYLSQPWMWLLNSSIKG
jgi:hypothetical protein